MSEPMTGPERIQAAIERDRGMTWAPTEPVTLCGGGHLSEADIKAWRDGGELLPLPPGHVDLGRPQDAADLAEYDRRIARGRERIANRLVDAAFCPACLRLRFNPSHWLSCRRAQ